MRSNTYNSLREPSPKRVVPDYTFFQFTGPMSTVLERDHFYSESDRIGLQLLTTPLSVTMSYPSRREREA